MGNFFVKPQISPEEYRQCINDQHATIDKLLEYSLKYSKSRDKVTREDKNIIIKKFSLLMKCHFHEQVCYDVLHRVINKHIDEWEKINVGKPINKTKYTNETTDRLMPLLIIYKYYVLSRED